jgi:hypothetical protein
MSEHWTHKTTTIGGDILLFNADVLARASDNDVLQFRWESESPERGRRTGRGAGSARYIRGLIHTFGFSSIKE